MPCSPLHVRHHFNPFPVHQILNELEREVNNVDDETMEDADGAEVGFHNPACVVVVVPYC